MSSEQEKDEHVMPNVKRWIPGKSIVLVEGEGAIVRDTDGNEYIDLLGSHAANSVGHCHPKLTSVLKEQADKLQFITTDFSNIPAAMLAEKLAQITPKSIKRFYFLNSGAEAVECALYLARRYSKKYEIVALYGAFHGRTYGARSLVGWSGYKKGMGPFLSGVHHIPWYYCYRCNLGLEYPECDLRCARMLDDALMYQCGGDVAAFIAEPMMGTVGVVPAPDGYFKEVKKILDSHDVLFICDEVMSGCGRTGRLFEIERHGVEPDIMTMAKALGGGAVPISATGASEEVACAFKPMDYFTTYGCNPLVCAVSLSAIEILIEDNLYQRSEKLGKYFINGLNELAEKYELIGDVRGRGLFIGVELVKDKVTKEPAREEALKLRVEAMKRGLILPSGWGWLGNVTRIHPPFIITEEQIDKTINIMDSSLKAIQG